MTVNTTNITGFIVLPDDTVREKSSVIFTMTGFDTDADDNATVVPIPREAPIAVDGSIDIDLWPNQEGVRSTFYRVTFSIYNGNKPYLVDGGLIEVPVTGGPYDLNDLLPIEPPQGATVEEYIAQLAASVAAAEAAADRAETAAAGVLGPFATRAAFVTWAGSNAADDGVVASDGTVQYVASAGATAISDLPGWLPFGDVSVKHFGAVCDGTTDDLVAFNSANSYGVSPVVVPSSAYISAGITSPAVSFELTNGATVTQGTGGFFPREWRSWGNGGDSKRLVNFAADDPSPSSQPADTSYPILTSGAAVRIQGTNYWGNGDLVSNSWRTGVDALLVQGSHYGKGDYYLSRFNGTVYQHEDHGSVTGIAGHNNIGMFNGQVNAGGDQTTLYGLGDVVLHDQGYDNIAMRGMVMIMYHNGSDTYGYNSDRFGHMVWSNGDGDIAGAFIARGKMRAAIDTTDAELSDNAAVKMAGGQFLFFDSSGANQSTGYVAPSNGSYHLGKASGSYLESAADGSFLRQYNNHADFTPSSDGVATLRAYSFGTPGNYVGIGQIGNNGYLSSVAASGNASLIFSTTFDGSRLNALSIEASGNVNILGASSSLKVGGVSVVGSRKIGWTAATGTATRTAFDTATVTTEEVAERVKAIIDDLTNHGLIGA